MAAILDIIIATALGSILFVIILNANHIASETASEYNGNVLVQQLLISTVQLVESEFRNMGYGVADTLNEVVDAQPSSVSFLCRRPGSSDIDTTKYFLSPAGQLPGIQNDSMRLINRQVNSGPVYSVGMATQFNLRYFTQGQADELIPPIDPIDLGSIKVIELTLEVQSPYALYRNPADVRPGERNALYSSSLWRQTRLASQNLNRGAQ